MILTLLTFLPVIYAVLVWMLPSQKLIRPVSLALSVAHFLFSLVLLTKYDASSSKLQLVEQHAWVEQLGISYFMALDGLSLWLVILSTFLLPVIILGSWTAIEKEVRAFHVNMFLLATTMIGTFLAMDAVLFYMFFEASLIPMYLIVGVWGGARRIYATLKFFLFTMFGSVLMLVSIITLMIMTEIQLGQMTSSLLDFYKLEIPFIGGEFFNPQTLMFSAFALAFAIKVPMFPVHTWLPDAHVEAPTPGSVVLAGVMLKMGTYGFLRFVIPLFSEATEYYSWVFLFLGVMGIIYGALVAMVQPDIKKLVAYSSVSHMGYVMIGLFALNVYGITGGLYQMLNHGISTGALFLLVGMIYERTHSREISKYGGLALAMPMFTIAFFIVTLSSIAVPGTNGFIGEFYILLGTFEAHKIYGAFAASGVVLGAVYMLWMFKRVFFGQPGELLLAGHGHEESHGHNSSAADDHASGHGHHVEQKFWLKDLSVREIVVLAPLVILVFWMGLFPNHFMDKSKSSIEHLVKNRHNYTLEIAGN